jgi:hypothetical protein
MGSTPYDNGNPASLPGAALPKKTGWTAPAAAALALMVASS